MDDGLKIFVVGCARSGTSITYYAMREVIGLPGAGESHTIPIFQRVLHQFYLYHKNFAKNDPNVLASSLNSPDFRSHIIDYIRNFYYSVYPGGRWVDKTPGAEAILGATLIRECFPDAKLVCTKRTGVEVVQSFRNKFSSNFEDACRAWTAAMEALLKIRAASAPILELEQHDIANAPDRVAKALVDHIGKPEKLTELCKFFAEKRTDTLSSHDWRKRLRIKDAGWTAEEKALFQKFCGDMMQTFEYTT